MLTLGEETAQNLRSQSVSISCCWEELDETQKCHYSSFSLLCIEVKFQWPFVCIS